MLKAIYGYNHEYKDPLATARLETLETRRDRNFERFTRKTVKNPKFMHWFPEKEHQRFTRRAETVEYVEKFSKSTRLYNSPIFAMRRLLNATLHH